MAALGCIFLPADSICQSFRQGWNRCQLSCFLHSSAWGGRGRSKRGLPGNQLYSVDDCYELLLCAVIACMPLPLLGSYSDIWNNNILLKTISMVLLTGVNNVFLNKMLNFNNPISMAWKSLHGVPFQLFLLPLPSFALWWMKVLELAVSLGSGVCGVVMC